eukprot:2126146-Amphidinium_carterae.1
MLVLVLRIYLKLLKLSRWSFRTSCSVRAKIVETPRFAVFNSLIVRPNFAVCDTPAGRFKFGLVADLASTDRLV